jgi:hypothetical protein
MASIGLDRSSFERDLMKVKFIAHREGREIERGLRVSYGASGGPTSIPGGHKAVGGASSAMLVSVARDTAASLASGANPFTVLMQQAPQVLQAITMMGLALKTVLVTMGALGAVFVATFVTHYVSKGIAGIVYGLDAIAARGEKLERTRQILRKLVEQAKEARELSFGIKVDELKSAESLADATERRLKAELDLWKAKEQSKNLDGMALGNLDQENRIKKDMLKKEIEAGKAKLDEISRGTNKNDSPETIKMRGELAKLESTPLKDKSEAIYDEMTSLKARLKQAEASDEENRQAKIIALQAEIQTKENEVKALDLPAKSKADKTRAAAVPLTGWQQMGAMFGGPNTPLLEVNKSMERHLREIRDRMARTGPDDGVNYGG